MSDPQSNAEDSLRKLGQRLRHGWERTRPVTPQEMEKVRRAVREQWEKEHHQDRARTPDTGSPTQDPNRSHETPQPPSKTPPRDRGHEQTQ